MTKISTDTEVPFPEVRVLLLQFARVWHAAVKKLNGNEGRPDF